MDENYKTRVVNESFDTCMLRLAIAKGSIKKALKEKILSKWTEFEADNHSVVRELNRDMVAGLAEV
jgi:hypothetical protein